MPGGREAHQLSDRPNAAASPQEKSGPRKPEKPCLRVAGGPDGEAGGAGGPCGGCGPGGPGVGGGGGRSARVSPTQWEAQGQGPVGAGPMWQRAPAQCAQPDVLSGHHSQTPHVALPQQSSRQASIVVAPAARVSSGQNDSLTEERNSPAGQATPAHHAAMASFPQPAAFSACWWSPAHSAQSKTLRLFAAHATSSAATQAPESPPLWLAMTGLRCRPRPPKLIPSIMHIRNTNIPNRRTYDLPVGGWWL